jgi:hypothetical protein
MRLLNTTKHKLEEFGGNEIPLYAILSHIVFLLFRMFDSIYPGIPKALQSYSLIECHPGTASKMATITKNLHNLHLHLPLHFRLHFILLALLAFKLVSEMSHLT